jgi:hypothetical protein
MITFRKYELLEHDPMETESLLVQQKSAANVTEEAIAIQGGDVTAIGGSYEYDNGQQQW